MHKIIPTVALLLLGVVEARQRGLMGIMNKMQPKPSQQERKRTETIKPSFLRTGEASSPSSNGNKKGGVDHVVLLKVDLVQATKYELQKLRKGARALTTISGVESVTVGEVFIPKGQQQPTTADNNNNNNNNDKTQGYNYYLRIRVASTEKLQTLAEHPLHQAYFGDIAPILTTPPLTVDCTGVVVSAAPSAGMAKIATTIPQRSDTTNPFSRYDKVK